MNSLLIAASETRRRLGLARNPFLGEVLASDFITGNALAAVVGLSDGVAQNSNEPWLKFKDPVDGKTKYVAKHTYRHSISRDHLDAVGIVTGNRTITVGGKTYRVRLMKGAPSNPYLGASGRDLIETHGSEWNRLMYRVIINPFGTTSPTSEEGIVFGEWAKYDEVDMWMTGKAGNGYQSWCQESSLDGNRLARSANAGVRYVFTSPGATASLYLGWRPVLELIE